MDTWSVKPCLLCLSLQDMLRFLRLPECLVVLLAIARMPGCAERLRLPEGLVDQMARCAGLLCFLAVGRPQLHSISFFFLVNLAHYSLF
jgi:hypothetical protein